MYLSYSMYLFLIIAVDQLGSFLKTGGCRDHAATWLKDTRTLRHKPVNFDLVQMLNQMRGKHDIKGVVDGSWQS